MQGMQPRPTHQWRMSTLISTIVVVAMALMASALITVGWLGLKSVLLQTSTVKAKIISKITKERADNLIDHAETLLRLLSVDPIYTMYSLDDRLQRLNTFHLILIDNPQLSAVYVGYDNGDSFLMMPLTLEQHRTLYNAPAHAAYLVRNVSYNGSAKEQRDFLFYDEKFKLIEHRNVPDYDYDPRTRPWYQKTGDSINVSQPYAYAEKPLIGITMSLRTQHAVVAMDLPLSGIHNTLQHIKLTPHTQIALVDQNRQIIATNVAHFQQIFAQQGEFELPKLNPTNFPVLNNLWQEAHQAKGQHITDNSDRDWLGQYFQLVRYKDLSLDLLVATPRQELLNDLSAQRRWMILFAVSFGLLFLPLGWWVGRRIGRMLEDNVQQVKQMSHFDFSLPTSQGSRLYEVYQLQDLTDDIGRTIQGLLDIIHILNTEQNIDEMLNKVLAHFVETLRSDAGAVYLYQDDSTLLKRYAAVGSQSQIEPLAQQLNEQQTPDIDRFATCQAFPIYGRRQRILGYVLVTHSGDNEHTSEEFIQFSQRVTGMLAVSIETRQLIKAQQQLLDAFIEVLADAVDAKSAYTGGHCRRVPELALHLVETLSQSTTGQFADFKCEGENYEAFRIAAWLHDCGKVTTPEHIVDKATKLETIYNRIHEIRTRFEVLWRDADIDYLNALNRGEDASQAQAQRHAKQQQLQADFAFVAKCNIGGEFMSDEDVARLEAIAQTTWQRHFDQTLGLSPYEQHKLADAPQQFPATEQLLANKQAHITPWHTDHQPIVTPSHPKNSYGFDMTVPQYQQNMGELYNLSVRRGTLTAEDRFIINDHIVQTLIMLSKLPWPSHLKRIPDLASNHHEKMDGTGYPRRLRGEQMSVEERVLALVDVFEALTAADRPYKPAKTISQSLIIMANMAKGQHLDKALFRYFIEHQLWQDYAQKYLQPEQIDQVDVAKLLHIIAE